MTMWIVHAIAGAYSDQMFEVLAAWPTEAEAEAMVMELRKRRRKKAAGMRFPADPWNPGRARQRWIEDVEYGCDEVPVGWPSE